MLICERVEMKSRGKETFLNVCVFYYGINWVFDIIIGGI